MTTITVISQLTSVCIHWLLSWCNFYKILGKTTLEGIRDLTSFQDIERNILKIWILAAILDAILPKGRIITPTWNLHFTLYGVHQ